MTFCFKHFSPFSYKTRSKENTLSWPYKTKSKENTVTWAADVFDELSHYRTVAHNGELSAVALTDRPRVPPRHFDVQKLVTAARYKRERGLAIALEEKWDQPLRWVFDHGKSGRVLYYFDDQVLLPSFYFHSFCGDELYEYIIRICLIIIIHLRGFIFIWPSFR